MRKAISSDVVIGNFLIETLERDREHIEFKNLFDFDKKISKTIRGKNYSTKFSVNSIFEFQDNYPFFVSLSDDNCLTIVKNGEKNITINRLIRHFRIGLPTFIVEKVSLTYKNLFDRK
jgi:hypothetical protein